MAASGKVPQTAAVVELGALLDAREGAVVTLVAGETRLAAHRAVLSARSPVFEAMFGHDTREATCGEADIQDVAGAVLRQLLVYCYTLQAPQLPDMAPELLAAADKYGLPALKAECEQHLAAELSVEAAAATAVLAVRHSCRILTEAAIGFIKGHGYQVMATQGWADAMRNQVEDVIEVNKLLAEPPAEDSSHGRTPAGADEAAISHYRNLSAYEKGRKLRQAARESAVDEMRVLLAAGADVGARDSYRRTALHHAADPESARCLLEGGAEVDARASGDLTPLHTATLNSRTDVLRLLVEASADVNARAAGGLTPLHLAAANGDAEAAAALLEAGADRVAADSDGRTPQDLATLGNHHQLLHLLTQE